MHHLVNPIKINGNVHTNAYSTVKRPTCRKKEVSGVITSSHTQTLVNTHTHKNTCRFTQRPSYSQGLVRLPPWSFNLHGSTLIPQSYSSLFHSGDPGGKYQSEAGHVDYCFPNKVVWGYSLSVISFTHFSFTVYKDFLFHTEVSYSIYSVSACFNSSLKLHDVHWFKYSNLRLPDLRLYHSIKWMSF